MRQCNLSAGNYQPGFEHLKGQGWFPFWKGSHVSWSLTHSNRRIKHEVLEELTYESSKCKNQLVQLGVLAACGHDIAHFFRFPFSSRCFWTPGPSVHRTVLDGHPWCEQHSLEYHDSAQRCWRRRLMSMHKVGGDEFLSHLTMENDWKWQWF